MKRRMTLDTFLKALRRTPRTWRVIWGVRLRCRSGGGIYCPIEVVSRMRGGPSNISDADTFLGLSEQTTYTIMDAADCPSDHTRTRKRLLRACGLSE